MDNIIELRNGFTSFVYKQIVKPICFMNDPEDVHNFFVKTGKFLSGSSVTKDITSALFNYRNKALAQKFFGLEFQNPVGLSAGFDKNGEAVGIMEDVGFGFAEIGSITARPCAGNPGKRLERLIEQKSIWVNMGLNNKGASSIYGQLKDKNFGIPVGISAAKTNCKETTDPEVGLSDYLFTIKTFRPKVDFFVLNISCPNAFGGQDFAVSKLFERLAAGVSRLKLKQPVFVKISPDLSKKNIDRIVDISARYGMSGFICTNLTKKHGFSKGGLSGKAVEKRANRTLSYVYRRSKRTGKRFVIVGTGGIFSAEDAYKKIKLGADLVELITGMIYQGPQLIGEINYNLVKLMERDGFSNIKEAVGRDAKI